MSANVFGMKVLGTLSLRLLLKTGTPFNVVI